MTNESNYYAISIAMLSDWLEILPKFFNQWEAKPKAIIIAACMHDFSQLLVHVIARNSVCSCCDWSEQ